MTAKKRTIKKGKIREVNFADEVIDADGESVVSEEDMREVKREFIPSSIPFQNRELRGLPAEFSENTQKNSERISASPPKDKDGIPIVLFEGEDVVQGEIVEKKSFVNMVRHAPGGG